jgi:hypothetical protein
MDVMVKVYLNTAQLSYDGTCRSKLARLQHSLWPSVAFALPFVPSDEVMMMTGLGCFGSGRRHSST